MSKQPFNNDASQEERYQIVVNDRRASTYHSYHLPEEDLPGRFRKLEPRTIVGSDDPIPSYTRSAPWSSTQLPDEPPLGWSVEEQAPVGEPHEVEASIGNDRSRVACDATAFSTVASSEEPAPAPRSPSSSAGVISPADRGDAAEATASKGDSAPSTIVEPVAQPFFKRRV